MNTTVYQGPTCGVIRMKMGEKVILAPRVLEVESINHEVGAIDPFQMLNLLCHFAAVAVTNVELEVCVPKPRLRSSSDKAGLRGLLLECHLHHRCLLAHHLGRQTLQSTLR